MSNAYDLLGPKERAAMQREVRKLILFRTMAKLRGGIEIDSHQRYCEALHRMRSS